MSVEFIGPFSQYRVTVDGWEVPYLEGHVVDDRLYLTLDNRLGFDCDASEAETVTRFVAHAIAIGLGYSCHPGAEAPDPPRFKHFRKLTGLAWQFSGSHNVDVDSEARCSFARHLSASGPRSSTGSSGTSVSGSHSGPTATTSAREGGDGSARPSPYSAFAGSCSLWGSPWV